MNPDNKIPRREFVKTAAIASAAGIILGSPLPGYAAQKSWTVGQIMDLFIKETTDTPMSQTVDTLKAGNRDIVVKGIVTAMFATIPVIKQSISLGANFIIAHEPTFYNHLDRTDWLENDATYKFKRKLLDDNGIAVWRNHDYIHSHSPDGVYDGVLKQLDWTKYAQPSSPWNIQLPSTTVGDVIKTVKTKLGIKSLRYVGDDKQACSKVLLMPGAAGGERQIKAISEMNPDLAIVGELQEWETAEYVRDARAAGKKISLIVLGHIDSEDGGSEYMKSWLIKNVPGIKVSHLNSVNPFSYS